MKFQVIDSHLQRQFVLRDLAQQMRGFLLHIDRLCVQPKAFDPLDFHIMVWIWVLKLLD